MTDTSPNLEEILAGRYVLKREIGRGGAAAVYLGHDVRHERLVAVKVLHPELSHALGAQRFMREIRLTASLQHPHILPIHDSGSANDQLFYVMPYVEGDSMRHRMGADNRLPIEDAVRIGREVADALAYAHARGVVHRDIKPENILFSGGHAIVADFGIARAINRAHEKITQQGTITGTPAYMSPEQARDRAFDGRSDVYSLACVLYEAIAGVPPFVGETPQQLLTQRISRTAPLLRDYRPDVPPAIEAVIAKALSISPDDRFDDANAFSAALSAAIGHSGETRAARIILRPQHTTRWLLAAAVALLVTGVATTTQGRERLLLLTGHVDTAQFAVAPFQYVGAPTPAEDQEPVSLGLYAAMREWNGLPLASDISVLEALQRSPGRSLDVVTAAARRAHAGKVIWGRVWFTGDSIRIRAAIYNTFDGKVQREVTAAGRRDLFAAQPGEMRQLATNLLRADPNTPPGRSGDGGTHSYAAWRAYEEGQAALLNWRVPLAIAAFERAAAADPDYAHAHTWLAQLLLWRAEPAARWGSHVNTALRNRASLDGRDVILLGALQALQAGLFSDACASYALMRERDSLDVVAWLGLAHCKGLDSMVVRSRITRTGWIFRGSMAEAQRAYANAVQIAPGAFGAFPFTSVTRLFAVENGLYRAGKDTDGAPYFGLPDVIADTLAYVPHPLAELNGSPLSALSPAIDRALQRNRETLLRLLSALTQRMPDNPDVFESLSRVLETRDDIAGTPTGGYSALTALDRAKTIATDSVQRSRLGATDVRLHLKLGDFSRTAAIGDSILSSVPSAVGGSALYLAGIAALLGREHAATGYQRASGETVLLSGPPFGPLLEDVSTALFMRSALGVCDDSLRALRTRITSLLESYVNAAQREQARTSMLARPTMFAVGCVGAPATAGLAAPVPPALRAVQLLGSGDPHGARSTLDSIQGLRVLIRPGEYSLDYTVAEAWLRAALGDTAAAMHQLDLTLTALPTLTPYVLFEPGMAAAVGRSMAYRAELASRRGDAGTAALWAGRVLTLWARSDVSLAPTLQRMRALAAPRQLAQLPTPQPRTAPAGLRHDVARGRR